MRNRDHLTPHRVIDKNGRAMTVYRNTDGASSNRSVRTAVQAPDADLMNQLVDDLAAQVVRPNRLSWDGIKWSLKYIQEWEKPWTEAEKLNLAIAQEIARITNQETFDADDEKDVRSLIASLKPIETDQKRNYEFLGRNEEDPNKDNWRARDKMLHSLANELLVRRIADDFTFEPVTEHITNESLIGLEEAQLAALREVNEPSWAKREDTVNLGENVEEYFQDAIARVVRGDEPHPYHLSSQSDLNLIPEPERVFAAMIHSDENYSEYRQLFYAAVWPVRELKKEMERLGVDNVTVTPFYNTREWGNVYTVMTPDGGTRSFCVYEHRNTDSIIINGVENWDGEDLPYAGESKQDFFAEFAPEDTDRAAQALTFYLSQAQQGTLEPPQNLVDKVSRRDWDAILSAQIPAYREWRAERFPTSDDILEDVLDKDSAILSRLDFETDLDT